MNTRTTPPTREFTVIHVATVFTVQAADASASPAKSPAKSLRPHNRLPALPSPAMLMLAALLYLVAVFGYVALAGKPAHSASEPWVWMLCLPYAALMIQKLLKTIRAMETRDFSEAASSDGRDEDEFGTQDGHDAIAVVGDVCIYVVGILLVCFVVLPWQVYVD